MSTLYSDFRALRVLVLHPKDRDGDQLNRALKGLRCEVEWMWPPLAELRRRVDVVFCLIDQRSKEYVGVLDDRLPPTIVGIANMADPATLGLLEGCGVHAVINKPVDATEILTSLLVARKNSRYAERLLKKIAKLEDTLRSARKIERAKGVLMQQLKIEEAQAYEFLRKHAMRKRVPINVVASAIVDSSEVLSDD